MPQVWMTYDELAALCGSDPTEARLRAIHLTLDRRRSRDGATRVKLDLALTAKFFAAIREADFDLDHAIEALRDTHRQMAELPTDGVAGEKRGTARGRGDASPLGSVTACRAASALQRLVVAKPVSSGKAKPENHGK